MIALLQELVRIPSPSREEGAVADFLEARLRSRGLEPRRCGNNLWCCSGSGPAVLLDAHIDTVRPVAGWTRDPFSASLEGGRLYGLGSNDDGASVVALIAAFERLTARPQGYTLVLSLSAEEEDSGPNGLETVLPEIEATCGPIVLGLFGEPTSLKMAVAEKGLMVLDCTVKGVAGHAARELGVNAIYEALPAIEWFRSKRFERVSPLLGPVKMSVTQIEAGTQHNVIPDVCRFVVDVRTTGPNEDVLARILGSVDCEVKARSTRLNGSTIGPEHPLVKAAEALGLETYASPTLSNQALCPFPTVKLGPGDPSLSHKADEYILIEEVEKGVQTYLKLLEAYENLG